MSATADEQLEYWDTFYRSQTRKAVPASPSDFARWVMENLPAQQSVLEFGFGTGRDSLWFASHGIDVAGFDFSKAAVEAAASTAATQNLTPSPRFSTLDLNDASAVDKALKQTTDDYRIVNLYGRFLLHSLEDRGRQNLFQAAQKFMPGHGCMYLEFRTGKDEDTSHEFGEDHFRNYLNSETIVEELEAVGATIKWHESGHGLAVYKSEDPHVARIVANWDSRT